jgi:transposase
MRFACEEDAQEALDSFRNSNPSLELHGIFVDGEPTYSKRGRPANDECPDDFKFFIRARPAMSLNTYGSNLEKRGWFVLATNHLESPEFSASAILSLYREQWIAESGFRFLKSPEFMTSSLYLKSPKRIEALLMVMTLCLLVYAALEYRIRKTLKEKGQTFPDQKGKPTPKPTARWVFHAFSGIDLLLMESKRIILNLKDRHTALLSVLGPPYEKYYFRET